MQSFDVLSRELNVLGHRFLEASAGTGKTFAIEHIVVRLLIEKGLLLEQILVVTFTRAATRELKMRIRANIAKAAEELIAKAASVDYLQALLGEGEKRTREAIRNLNDALACFDRAQIFTIHGFCYRMLQEFAFEAGVTFDLSDPEDETFSLGKRELIFDFFRTGLKPPLYGLSQIDAVLQRQQFDIKGVVNKLAKILERKSKLPTLPTFQEIHARFNGELKKTPFLEGEKILSDLRKLLPHFKKSNLPEAEKQLTRLLNLFAKGGASQEEFDLLLSEKNWFFELLHPENQKKRALLPSSGELYYPGIFDRFRETFLPLFREAQDPLKILIRMARDCSSTAPKEISFDELLHRMAESLTDPQFGNRIRSRFRALIVDEFQDTDPVQWKIFQTLFLDQGTALPALYLVGDPKQSIYRFRGADVYTYLRAASWIEERASLDTNFRAEKPLVHALNTLFSHVAQGNWLPLPSQESSLPFAPVKHREEEKKLEANCEMQKGAIHFFLAQDEKGREKSFPTIKMEREFFFPFIATEIRELPSRKCAVLVKDRFQAERLQSFLKQCGIPAVASRGRSLIDSKGFVALKQLLEALILPSQIKLVLAGPFFQFSHERLKNFAPSAFTAVFQEFRRCLEERGFAFFFSTFLRFVWEEVSVLERLLQAAEFYEELRACAEILIEEKPTASCEALLLFLEKMNEGEEEKVIHSHEENAVSILTTHMSKGLEFDFVFALSLASRHPVREDLIFVREEGEERVESLDLEAASSALYLKELDAEKLRQLYVALTRAKRRVYVPLAFDFSPSSYERGEGAPIELFFPEEKEPLQALALLEKLKKMASITYSVLDKQKIPLASDEKPAALLSPQKGVSLSFKRRALLSFSSLARKQEVDDPAVFEDLGEKNSHTLPLGAETGIILHEIFEKIFKKGLFSSERKEERELLIHWEVERSPLKGWSDVAVEIVASTLALPLPCQGSDISLEKLPARKVAQEMEFLFSVDDRLIKGFADLFFEWQDRYYLVDWKSNWLGLDDASYSPSLLEKAMHEHDYFLQGAIYAAAFERYVKLFDKRPFDSLFGGAFYIFLRGKKAFHFLPDRSMLTRVIKKGKA